MIKKNSNLKKEIEWLLKEKYNNIESKDFYADIKRLEIGEPLDYIIGSIPFLNCEIDLSYRPLIPRTETEFWVEKAINYIQKKPKQLELLDIFSGSGCIGIALAKHLQTSHVDFAEHDDSLISQIKKNIEKNNIDTKRTKVFLSDCFDSVLSKKYHYIFANPPYLSQGRLDKIQTSVLKHEPHKALFANDNGLYYIKKLIDVGRDYLLEHGTIFIEIDPHQKEPIGHYVENTTCAVTFWKDQFKNTRVALISYTQEG